MPSLPQCPRSWIKKGGRGQAGPACQRVNVDVKHISILLLCPHLWPLWAAAPTVVAGLVKPLLQGSTFSPSLMPPHTPQSGSCFLIGDFSFDHITYSQNKWQQLQVCPHPLRTNAKEWLWINERPRISEGISLGRWPSWELEKSILQAISPFGTPELFWESCGSWLFLYSKPPVWWGKDAFMPLSSESGSVRINSVLSSYPWGLCGSQSLLPPSKSEAWVGPSGLGHMTPGLAKRAQAQVVPYTKARLFGPLPGRTSLCLSEMVCEESSMT